MKIAVVTLTAVLSVVMAGPAPAPPVDPKNVIKCEVNAFKPSWAKLTACCKNSKGHAKLDRENKKVELECRLPWGNLVGFKKCVNDLNYSSIIDCERD
ncbi:hypothetical protein BGZ68_009281 [Mortierella alpina]|nr:hypothetical protein BGZ68_009281 [Mortierella alpina]